MLTEYTSCGSNSDTVILYRQLVVASFVRDHWNVLPFLGVRLTRITPSPPSNRVVCTVDQLYQFARYKTAEL